MKTSRGKSGLGWSLESTAEVVANAFNYRRIGGEAKSGEIVLVS